MVYIQQSVRMFSAVSSWMVFVGLLSVLLKTAQCEKHWPHQTCPQSRVGILLLSAALNIFLYHHAAVSEHRAGHVGEEGPRVGGGLIGFHVAQRGPLTADNASSRINLAVQHHSTVRERAQSISP